jgi:hypothetical protein
VCPRSPAHAWGLAASAATAGCYAAKQRNSQTAQGRKSHPTQAGGKEEGKKQHASRGLMFSYPLLPLPSISLCSTLRCIQLKKLQRICLSNSGALSCVCTGLSCQGRRQAEEAYVPNASDRSFLAVDRELQVTRSLCPMGFGLAHLGPPVKPPRDDREAGGSRQQAEAEVERGRRLMRASSLALHHVRLPCSCTLTSLRRLCSVARQPLPLQHE